MKKVAALSSYVILSVKQHCKITITKSVRVSRLIKDYRKILKSQKKYKRCVVFANEFSIE